ncbi:proline-rich receptor-like protein kinase PERK9 [Rhodamnia argentea]|uniref:Proline-rich receptor-like protein kinase PERK9 n=1 Tax=Rhodamnia argentea TaxID=178133 RepID=A0A8B8QW27_9MYRT|nr:proline-rich receptor-like protein kinase PERK9 [Rhodamnia argentea]
MRASRYSFAHSLSTLLLLFLLATAAQVRARPLLLAERLRMTVEDYGRSLRPLPLRHAASPPVMRPCKEMPATAAATATRRNNYRYDEVVGATYSPPPPPPKVAPPTHQITCLNSPPSDGDLIISMVTDLDFGAPSKSPPPPPKVAPPQKPGTDDLEAPSRSPPPPPKVAPPRKPGTNDFEAPSRSPPPPPTVSPPSHQTNNSERTYKSPPPSGNSLPSTHHLTEEFGRLNMINSERSPPSAESYYSAY